jgi:hypothetical protein
MQCEDAAMGNRGRQHQRERKVPHEVGLEQQETPARLSGMVTEAAGINKSASARHGGSHDVGRHRQDAVRRQRLEVGTTRFSKTRG